MLLFGIPLLLILLVVAFIGASIFFYFEVENWGGVFFLVALGLLGWIVYESAPSINALAASHGGWLTFIVKLAGAWVIAGAVTSLLKWLQLSNKMKRFIKEKRESFKGTVTELFDSFKHDDQKAWFRISKDVIRFEVENGEQTFKLNTGPFRDLMMDWMTYWPVHLAVLLFADMFRIIYDYIIDVFSGAFRRVTMLVWGSVLK